MQLSLFGLSDMDRNGILTGISICILLYIVVDITKTRDYIKRRILRIKDLNSEAKIRANEFAPLAMISVDAEGNVVAWNRKAEIMFGWTEKEMIGRSLTVIIPEKYREAHKQNLVRASITGDTSVIGRKLIMEGLTRAGKEFPITLTISKWMIDEQIIYTGIIKDNTESLAERQDFQKQICLLEKGEAVAEMGTWEWDVLNNIVYTSPEFNRIFDWDAGEAKASELMSRVCREDKDRVNSYMNMAVNEHKDYRIEYCVIAKDGSKLRVDCIAKCQVVDNMVYRIAGTVRIIEKENEA